MRVEAWSDEHAREVISWHYEPPYDFYDAASDPGDAAEMVDPAFAEHYRAVLDDDGRVAGFWYFRPHDDEVEVGLGLRPDLTGSGRGAAFSRAAVEYAREQWSPQRLRLFVAAWNARAIRVYEGLGFTEVRRESRTFELVGVHEFVEMERPA
jgi:ribosomal-protein-alanine N-acetyltransferase